MFDIAVAAVASLNVKIANNIQERNNAMSLVNLENITEAQETSTSGNETVIHNGVNVSYGTTGNVIATEYIGGASVRVVGCSGNGEEKACHFRTYDGAQYTGTGDYFSYSLR